MRRTRSILTIAVLLVSTMAACADEATPPSDGGWLDGITWILDRASVQGLEPDAPATAHATILFDDEGGVGGTAFCNQYGGTYEADDADLTIQVGSMTEMGCEEPMMSMEPAFVDFLGSVRSFTVDGTTLTLVGDGTTLTFDAERHEPLVGTTWRVDGLIDGDVASSTIAGTRLFLLLEADGSAMGDGGCNRFMATYTLDGDRLSFGPIETTTKMACKEQGVTEQEAAILRALASTARADVQGQVLSLYDGGGALVLTLVVA